MENRSSWSVSYNAKFTLTFCLICLFVLGIQLFFGEGIIQLLSLKPTLTIRSVYELFTYVVCHANFQHFIGNVLFLLMLGPILEEKYGSKNLMIMTLATALITGLVNSFLIKDSIIGASGIVFMFIVLASVVNIKEKEIPLTFIFIVIIYIGGELIEGFNDDNISQFGHVFGGICGGVFGFLFRKIV